MSSLSLLQNFRRITCFRSLSSSSSQLYSSLMKIILTSDKSNEDKEQLLVKLFNYQNEVEKSGFDLQLKLKEEKIQHLMKENVYLEKEKEQQTLYKLHYQQLLTVRSVIENFEKGFEGSTNEPGGLENR